MLSPKTEVMAYESDLSRFLNERIDRSDTSDVLDSGFGAEMIKRIVSGSQGMRARISCLAMK